MRPARLGKRAAALFWPAARRRSGNPRRRVAARLHRHSRSARLRRLRRHASLPHRRGRIRAWRRSAGLRIRLARRRHRGWRAARGVARAAARRGPRAVRSDRNVDGRARHPLAPRAGQRAGAAHRLRGHAAAGSVQRALVHRRGSPTGAARQELFRICRGPFPDSMGRSSAPGRARLRGRRWTSTIPIPGRGCSSIPA